MTDAPLCRLPDKVRLTRSEGWLGMATPTVYSGLHQQYTMPISALLLRSKGCLGCIREDSTGRVWLLGNIENGFVGLAILTSIGLLSWE